MAFKQKTVEMGDGNRYVAVRTSPLSQSADEIREKLRLVHRTIMGDSNSVYEARTKKESQRIERLQNNIAIATSIAEDPEIPFESRERYFILIREKLEPQLFEIEDRLASIQDDYREVTERVIDYATEIAVWGLTRPPNNLDREEAIAIATPEKSFAFVAAMLGLATTEDDSESPLG